MRSFPFRRDRRFSPLLRLWLVNVRSADVLVDGGLTVRFGPWALRTDAGNIKSVEPSGPFRWWRAVGIRLSLADRGITFGTTPDQGVCVCFHSPVSTTFLGHRVPLRHPNLTVTVADPAGLVAAVRASLAGGR